MKARAGVSMLVVAMALGALVGCGWRLQTRPAAAAQGEGTRSEAQTRAPEFSLANDDGSFVSLDELLAGGRPAVLVFYRGHW